MLRDLGADEPKQAWRAIRCLESEPARAVPLLSRWLKGLPRLDGRDAKRLVAELDADDFDVRERATKALERLGREAAGALQEALQQEDASPELRRRAQPLLRRIAANELGEEERRAFRAVAALERIGTPEARAALRLVQGRHPGSRLSQDAEASLWRLAHK